MVCFGSYCFSFKSTAEDEEEDEEEEEQDEEDEEDSEEDDEEEDEEGDLDVGCAPTLKRRKIANYWSLKLSLNSGRYPEYKGTEGPCSLMDPASFDAYDFVHCLWPTALCDVIVQETNRYARDRMYAKWVDIHGEGELWTFFAIVILMGIHRLPAISDYWSKDWLLGVTCVSKLMSSHRFWAIWSNLHVVNNAFLSPGDGVGRKLKPVLDTLSDTFLSHYDPGQELSIDEAMCKYKGRVKGKVHMPKKPIKRGFKIWCCCCCCCGYLCTFQVYDGKPVDPCTGKQTSEKGMVKRVVKDLLVPFGGLNHVVYCDNYFTSGPLIDELAEEGIHFAGTIKQSSSGFPSNLKEVDLPKGSYASEMVGDICYSVFHDRKVVSFATNAFPAHMTGKVARVQSDGVLRSQSVPPVLPAYNKFMGAVDRLSQYKKTYGFDRKSKRYWLRLFFQFLDYAVNNAYFLYQRNCKHFKVKAKELKEFRLDLVRQILHRSGKMCRYRQAPSLSAHNIEWGPSTCRIKRLQDMGMSRGRCQHSIHTKKKPKYTSYGCSFCRVRLCIDCFTAYHQ